MLHHGVSLDLQGAAFFGAQKPLIYGDMRWRLNPAVRSGLNFASNCFCSLQTIYPSCWSTLQMTASRCSLGSIAKIFQVTIILLLVLFYISYQPRQISGQDYDSARDDLYEDESSATLGGHCPQFNYLRAHPYGTDPMDPNPMMYITSLTEVQPLNWDWMPVGSQFFAESCPNLQPWMRCHYTKEATPYAINRSHALLFHVRHMVKDQKARKTFKGLPTIRHPHQKWVFYEPECPTNTWNYANRKASYWKMFNLTATFTMDSNIPVQFHQRTCRPIPDWKPSGINYAGNKSLAAWFVSHCTCSSKRELYVAEMMKYMPVDIYGDCGNSNACNRHTTKHADACMVNLLTKKYKFYLSFENAFCSHYVTEKFHRMIAMVDVVPVVMGAADYVNILPAGSYINVRDFNSPKALAEFLLKLDKDDQLYNQYIERKKSYNCEPPLPFGCSLCEYLHNHRYETQMVYDAASFWSVENRCTDPRYFFKGIADEIIPRINYTIDPSLFL